MTTSTGNADSERPDATVPPVEKHHAPGHAHDYTQKTNEQHKKDEFERTFRSCCLKVEKDVPPYKDCCCTGCCSIWAYLLTPPPISVYCLASSRPELCKSGEGQKVIDGMVDGKPEKKLPSQVRTWVHVLINFFLVAIWCGLGSGGGVQQSHQKELSPLPIIGGMAAFAAYLHLYIVWSECRKAWKRAYPHDDNV